MSCVLAWSLEMTNNERLGDGIDVKVIEPF
jgi:hypothetical protein